MQANISRRAVANGLLLVAGLWTTIPARGQQATSNLTELEQLRSQLKRIEARIDVLEAAEAAAQKPPVPLGQAATAPVETSSNPVQVVQPRPGAATGSEAVKEAEDHGMEYDGRRNGRRNNQDSSYPSNENPRLRGRARLPG